MNSFTNKLLFSFTIFSILLTQSFNLAQTSSKAVDTLAVETKLWNDIQLSFNNNLSYFERPVSFNSSDWLKFAGITIVSGALMTVDDEVREKALSNQSNFQNDFTKIGKYYGELVPIVGFSAVIYGGGLLFDDNEFRTTGRILIESLAAAGITTTALKFIFGRSRPYKNDGEYKFNFFDLNNYNNSFPSGHATVAFSISTVLSERIDNIYASIGLYGLATLTAYQRIYSDNHWLSDTFLGAIIGITAGKFFVNLEEDVDLKNKSSVSYHIHPYINSKSSGLSVSILF